MNEQNIEFACVPAMDNESKTAFGIMFFKESGKHYITEYFTASKPVSDYNFENRAETVYELNEAVKLFARRYGKYRSMTAVIISGEISYIIPHLIPGEHRD